MSTPQETVAIAKTLFEAAALPRPFVLLDAVCRVLAGESCEDVAREARCRNLGEIVAAPDPISRLFKTDHEKMQSEAITRRVTANLGQLLIGRLAERAFERIYREEMHTSELKLEDDRASGSDTDYRVLNGSGRPVFRMNIKFHGSLFRRALDLVGLEPEDCFALATYKIHAAILKQNAEHLPYVFVVIGVPHLTGEVAGTAIPAPYARFAVLVHASEIPGKRLIEDRIVNLVTETPQLPDVRASIQGFENRIAAAEWRVISARRADLLVREKLFERVYAVRVRGFARNYRNAELDMHFSISQELTPLRQFLRDYAEHGLHGLVLRLERGTI